MALYLKFSVYLSTMQEEAGEFRAAVQTLRASLGKLVEFREERLKLSLDYALNPLPGMNITVDNLKIGELESRTGQVYGKWEQLILRKERERQRRDREEGKLEEDEGDEEEDEVDRCVQELKHKEVFERGINVEEWRKASRQEVKKYYSEGEQVVHALHCDLLVNLYRCEIKLGREMAVVKTQTNKMLVSQGIDLTKNAPGNLTKNLS